MAVAAGSVVAVSKVSAQLTVGISFMVEPPLFGKVEDGADPFDVIWADGTKTSAISNTNSVLDEIKTPADATLDLVGSRVRIEGQNAALDIVVVSAYKRGSTDVVLGQMQSGGWRELAASAVTVIP